MTPTARTPLLSSQHGAMGTNSERPTPLLFMGSVAVVILVMGGAALGGGSLLYTLGWWPKASAMALAPLSAATGVTTAALVPWAQASAVLCLVSACYLTKVLSTPSCKGECSTPLPLSSPPPKKKVSSRVQELMGVIGSAKERQIRRDQEAEREAAIAAARSAAPAPPPRDATREPPPVQQVGESEWVISGMYEHQVLKSGLWHLDRDWPEEGLYDLPSGGVVDPFCGRRKLILDLLRGDVKLSSVLKADLEAAQYGVRSLSLRQLLRIRVLHLAFTPSGCGSDVVATLGGSHMAFLTSVDRALFEQIGRKATEGVGKLEDHSVFHRFGREAVFFTAAAAAVTSASVWVWWLGPQQRVLFHAKSFTCVPGGGADGGSAGGILEVMDASRPDVAEPTGKLRWMDWRVTLLPSEDQLSPVPKLFGGEAADHSADATAIQPNGGSGSAGSSATSLKRNTFSVELLCSTRSSLRKTGHDLSLGDSSSTEDPEQGSVESPTGESSDSIADEFPADLCSNHSGANRSEAPVPAERPSAALAPPPMPVVTADMVQEARNRLKKSASR